MKQSKKQHRWKDYANTAATFVSSIRIPIFSQLKDLRTGKIIPDIDKIDALAKKLSDTIFQAIYNNHDEGVFLHDEFFYYENFEGFIERTTMTLHKIMSADNKKLQSKLRSIRQLDNTEQAHSPVASYGPRQKQIDFYTTNFESYAIPYIAGLIAHEYTHILQHAGISAIPNKTLKFIQRYNLLYRFFVPYHSRITEKEALVIENRIIDYYEKMLNFPPTRFKLYNQYRR